MCDIDNNGKTTASNFFPSSGNTCQEEAVQVNQAGYASGPKKIANRTYSNAVDPRCNNAMLVTGQTVGANVDAIAQKIGSQFSSTSSGTERDYESNPDVADILRSEQQKNPYGAQNQHIVHLFSSCTFSLASANANPEAAVITVDSKGVFDCKTVIMEIDQKTKDVKRQKVSADLKTAVLTGVYLEYAKNSHSVPVGVSIDNVRGHVYNNHGDVFSFVIPSNSLVTYPKGLGVFKRKKLDEAFTSRFLGLTEKTIVLGIWESPKKDTVFVDPRHAVVDLLKRFPEAYPLDKLSKYRGMYEMKKVIVKKIIDVIKEKALVRLPYVDLRRPVMRLKRADVSSQRTDGAFIAPDGNLSVAMINEPLGKYLTETPFSVEISLRFQYFVTSALEG